MKSTTTGNPLGRTLRVTGRRFTGQRQLLLQVLQDHGGHLDVNELFRLARMRNSRLSLSTVYRTMGLLRDLGLVYEVHLGEEHHHYELTPQARHCHLVCSGCGAIVEIGCGPIEQLRESIAAQYDFELAVAQADLVGLCGACRRA